MRVTAGANNRTLNSSNEAPSDLHPLNSLATRNLWLILLWKI